MSVLVGCEFSQIVTKAFRNLGIEAYSCDLLPTEGNPDWHLQMDVFEAIGKVKPDLGIFHPPCTYLTLTGNKWMKKEFEKRFPNRCKQREEAKGFFMKLVNAPVPRIAIENPVGIMSTCYRKPDQYIQPYYFGDPEPKKTGLWLKNLPKLQPTNLVVPRVYTYKDGRHDSYWHVETMKLLPQERMMARSRTFQGFANAMANQWGKIVLRNDIKEEKP